MEKQITAISHHRRQTQTEAHTHTRSYLLTPTPPPSKHLYTHPSACATKKVFDVSHAATDTIREMCVSVPTHKSTNTSE